MEAGLGAAGALSEDGQEVQGQGSFTCEGKKDMMKCCSG